MRDVRQFIAVSVTLDAERGNITTEESLELRFRAKCQRSHFRVQPVGADNQIGVFSTSVGQRRNDTYVIWLDCDDRNAEAGEYLFARAHESTRQVGPRD